jgi:putative ABC transport system ATP-binding protein
VSGALDPVVPDLRALGVRDVGATVDGRDQDRQDERAVVAGGYDLVKSYRRGGIETAALRGVTFEVRAGEVWFVLGPSGSGKSTLLSLLAGLDRPTSGSVVLDGQAIEGLDEGALSLLRRRTIGFVFQSFQLLGNFTAAENVMLPLELLGRPRVRERARELLARVGLGDRGHHYPSQLSGGEQQRVALARAFAPDPALLLADEPTGNLDGENGRVVLDLMLGMRRDLGTTLVLVTHDAGLAGRADRVIRLCDGRVVEGAR